VPIEQRATLGLAKELGASEEEEHNVKIAAARLVDRFKEPLSDVDMDGLAKLTRIDRDAMIRAAEQATATRAAAMAM
jgi:hypothetical protein